MTSTAAGWRPLPNDSSIVRYWDGQQWTDHYRHYDGQQWVDGLRAPDSPAEPTQPEHQEPLQSSHDQPQPEQPHQAPQPTYKRMWIIPTAVLSLVLLLSGGVYAFMALRDTSPVVTTSATGEDSGVDDGMSATDIEPIVMQDITHVLTSEVVYTDFAKGLDYTRPIVDVENREGYLVLPSWAGSFETQERPDWTEGPPERLGGGDNAYWAVRMFADPDLTVEIPIDINSGYQLSVAPIESALALDQLEDGELAVNEDIQIRENLEIADVSDSVWIPENYYGKWGLRDAYYIVRYISDDGQMERLERPVVSKVSFAQSLPTPDVRLGTVEGDPGTIELTWGAVPGAQTYKVFVSRMGEDSFPFAERRHIYLGETDGTRWNPDDDGHRTSRSVRNFGMETVTYGAEEDLTSLGTEYGVIAYDASGEKMSALGTVVATGSVVEALPSAFDLAGHEKYWEGLPCQQHASGCALADFDTTAPYISVGGEVLESQVTVSKVEWNTDWETYAAVMEIEGAGLLYQQDLGTQEEDEALAQAKEFNERSASERNPTGAIELVREGEIDTSAEAVSDVDPAVLSEINTMDHELVAYIASHMYEGNTAVDMQDYYRFWGYDDVSKAARVATAQNPHLGVSRTQYASQVGTLFIEYEDRERALQAHDEIRNILDDLGIDSMTDTQKIESINQYIVDHVEYDYEALDAALAGNAKDYAHAWTLGGAVFDQSVVCVGYAQMFLTMATEAGLDAVYVTGRVEGSFSGHAWNKVKIGDEWKIVDTTWNDVPGEPRYLMVNESEMPESGKRNESNDWLMGSNNHYATP